MSTPAIELSDVEKTYPGTPPVQALKPTSLHVRQGEKVAIVGASGSGKTTLLSLMGTLSLPSRGEISIAGENASSLRNWQRAALRSRLVGFVFQQFHLLAELTATENVALGLLYSGVTSKERTLRSRSALEQVGLAHRGQHKPGQLSGGEQQRVAIARALVRHPAVLFADEPTGALDSHTSTDILDLLMNATGEGGALIVVTHDLSVAQRFPRQLQVLDGRVLEGNRQS